MGQWNAIKTGDAIIVLQLTPKPHPAIPNVPLAVDLAKTKEGKDLIEIAMHGQNKIFRPFVLPPGTPKDRVEILRTAFMKTMQDPEFLEEANKSQLDIEPISGAEIQETVAELSKIDAEKSKRLRKVLYPRS